MEALGKRLFLFGVLPGIALRAERLTVSKIVGSATARQRDDVIGLEISAWRFVRLLGARF
jgi:hypothetical protein